MHKLNARLRKLEETKSPDIAEPYTFIFEDDPLPDHERYVRIISIDSSLPERNKKETHEA